MSSSSSNQEWIQVSRPSGLPEPSNWQLRSVPTPTLADGQILVRTRFLSVDPYLRGVIRTAPLNEPTNSFIVAEVVESKHADYKVGDIVTQVLPWRLYNAITPEPSKTGLRKVDPAWAPISTALGVLGMPGQTAYFGLFDAGNLKESDKTVLVSGAAGAVGSLVVQLAKWKGKTVIGTAGGKEKCEYVKSLGADYVIDYKQHTTKEAVQAELKKVAAGGIDVYFDNTSGHVTDAVWELMNKYGRVAICGAIHNYNATEPRLCPDFLFNTIYRSVNIRGFVVSDYVKEYGRFFAEVPALVKDGKVKYQETFFNGFERVPEAFIGLFHGVNTGKAVVKVE